MSGKLPSSRLQNSYHRLLSDTLTNTLNSPPINQPSNSKTARVLATLEAKEMPYARQEQDATPEIGQYVLRLPIV